MRVRVRERASVGESGGGQVCKWVLKRTGGSVGRLKVRTLFYLIIHSYPGSCRGGDGQ